MCFVLMRTIKAVIQEVEFLTNLFERFPSRERVDLGYTLREIETGKLRFIT